MALIKGYWGCFFSSFLLFHMMYMRYVIEILENVSFVFGNLGFKLCMFLDCNCVDGASNTYTNDDCR